MKQRRTLTYSEAIMRLSMEIIRKAELPFKAAASFGAGQFWNSGVNWSSSPMLEPSIFMLKFLDGA